MKYRFFAAAIVSLILMASCEDGPISSSYRAVLPELPRHWEEILGEAHWHFEWIGEDGGRLEKETASGREAPDLSLMQEWTTAILAWPFWPERDISPGVMRPAGALFPWDSSGGKVTLSWKGGVDAVFWNELAVADRPTTAAQGRLPWYFDWPRFRDLVYESGTVNDAVREDPWIADWKSIAQKTVQSGFDRRRIVSVKFTALSIPGFGGRWIGSSPFAAPLDADPDGPLYLSVTDTPAAWISCGGILKCSTAGWVWREQ